MWNITDWFLTKLNLVEFDEEIKVIEEELREDIILWLEAVGRKKIEEPMYNKHIFCKSVLLYDDA